MVLSSFSPVTTFPLPPVLSNQQLLFRSLLIPTTSPCLLDLLFTYGATCCIIAQHLQDLPCLDQTRVILADDMENNYIHANYVKMALMEPRIICTQVVLSYEICISSFIEDTFSQELVLHPATCGPTYSEQR